MSQKIKIGDLIPHKDNSFYFDDIDGEAWQEFVNSIKTSGVIEPIVITQNKVIVSGHQRVRACKTLGIDEIDAEVRIFDNDDDILKCLIDTNIRQRGIGNPNPVKFMRCIKEVERIAGVRQGSNNKTPEGQFAPQEMTAEQLAESYGISLDKWKRYKEIGNYIPEIQDLLETKIVTPSVAKAIVKKLPEFQQRELADKFASEGIKVPLKKAEEEIKMLKASEVDLKEERDYWQAQAEELSNREPEVVEVVPDDYEDLKKKAKKASAFESDYKKERNKALEKQNEILRLQDEIEELKRGSGEGVDSANISENVFYFCAICNNFISNVGGLVWLTERIADMPEREKNMFLKAARSFNDWSQVFKDNLERSLENGQTRTDTGIPLLTD